MKKMQKMIAVLFSVAMCAAMAVPAFAAETDTARNEEQETVMPRAIVYEKINIPEDGKFYKITDDFEMPAKSRVSFQGTWSPAYARLEFRLYAHSTGNGAYVMLTSGREGGLDATAASVYSLYARSVDNVKVTGAVNIRFLYNGIIIKHQKTEPTYTKTSLFLCEKRRFFMARREKGVVPIIYFEKERGKSF